MTSKHCCWRPTLEGVGTNLHDYAAPHRLPTPSQGSIGSVSAFIEYKAEMGKPDSDIDLLRCAALIAKHLYPNLDVDLCYTHIETIAQNVVDKLPETLQVGLRPARQR